MIEQQLNKADVARLFGVTTKTITNWLKDDFPRTGRGKATKYPVQECIEWYTERKIKDRLSRTEVGQEMLTEKEAKARKASYEAALKEFELYELQGSLVRVESVTAHIDKIITQLKNSILSIPGAWSEQLLGLKDRTQAMELLDTLTRKFLDQLADEDFIGEDEG